MYILSTVFVRFLLGFSFDWKDISNTQNSFDHVSETLQVCQKYFATRCISNSLTSVWKCGKTWFLVLCLIHFAKASKLIKKDTVTARITTGLHINMSNYTSDLFSIKRQQFRIQCKKQWNLFIIYLPFLFFFSGF